METQIGEELKMSPCQDLKPCKGATGFLIIHNSPSLATGCESYFH